MPKAIVMVVTAMIAANEIDCIQQQLGKIKSIAVGRSMHKVEVRIVIEKVVRLR